MNYLNIICLSVPPYKCCILSLLVLWGTTLSKFNKTKAWQPQGQTWLHTLVTKGRYSEPVCICVKSFPVPIWGSLNRPVSLSSQVHTQRHCCVVNPFDRQHPPPATCNYFLPVPKSFMDTSKIITFYFCSVCLCMMTLPNHQRGGTLGYL